MFLLCLDLEGIIKKIVELAKGKVVYCSRDLMVYPTIILYRGYKFIFSQAAQSI